MAKLKWYGDKVSEKIKGEARKAVHTAGEALLTEANKTVPHDEGTLERSGFVDSSRFGDIVTVIAYDTPSAVKVHEDTTLNFRGNGRSKWLENTAKSMSNKIENWIAKEMK